MLYYGFCNIPLQKISSRGRTFGNMLESCSCWMIERRFEFWIPNYLLKQSSDWTSSNFIGVHYGDAQYSDVQMVQAACTRTEAANSLKSPKDTHAL